MVFYAIKTVLCIALYLSYVSAQSDSDGTSQVGPIIANRADFPFQASLHMPNGTICGGIIYNNRTVITSAQCVDKVVLVKNSTEGVTIIVGHSELDKETNYTRSYNASSIVIHENFEKVSLRDDLALVKINESFEWNAHVQPLELVPASLNGTLFCNISGWNTIHGVVEKYSVLKRRKVHLTSKRFCTSLLEGLNLDTNANFCTDLGDDTMIEFSGDLGGPLICKGYLHGVQSTAFASGMHTYTDVRSHREWIERNHSKSLIYSPLSILLLFCNTLTTYLFIVSIFNWN